MQRVWVAKDSPRTTAGELLKIVESLGQKQITKQHLSTYQQIKKSKPDWILLWPMFGSSNRSIIQIQTSKTTQKWVTAHKTKLLLVIHVLWSEPCRTWVRWTEEEKLWIWRSGVILDEGMVSDLVSGVLWSEPCRRWVSELKRRSCESEDLEWFWMKEWSLISCQVFSDLNPVEDEWGELKRRSCESEDLEWFWMKEWSLISCQVFSDLNPVEDEWGELKRRSCESEDLEWFWMKEWSLISCQVFSYLIRRYRRTFRDVKLANEGFKKYWIKGCR